MIATEYADAFGRYQGYRPIIAETADGFAITTRTGAARYTAKDVRNLTHGLKRLVGL